MDIKITRSIGRPANDRVTQGTIITCCRDNVYSIAPVYGVVINARCDLVNGKVDEIAFLPVVPIASWLAIDAAHILKNRVSSECFAGIKKSISDGGFDESIADHMSIGEILQKLFPASEKKFTSIRKSIDGYTAKLNKIAAIPKEVSSAHRYLSDNFRKDIECIIKELLTHRLAGFHILPRVDGYADRINPHVVLLRKIRTLPAGLVPIISNGGSKLAVDKFQSTNGKLDFIAVSENDILMAIGQVRSPEIEHLLQAFSGQFTRIGVEDYSVPEITNKVLQSPEAFND